MASLSRYYAALSFVFWKRFFLLDFVCCCVCCLMSEVSVTLRYTAGADIRSGFSNSVQFDVDFRQLRQTVREDSHHHHPSTVKPDISHVQRRTATARGTGTVPLHRLQRDYNRSITMPHTSSPAPDDVITSSMCCASCTGFLFGN